jgi:methanogenic corrinoid protein MtbC1
MDNNLALLLKKSMRELDELQVLQHSVEMAAEGHTSYEIFELLLEGIREVDALYEAGQYFIADLIMAGHIMKSVMNKVLVFHGFEEFSSFGKVVIATVKDDIHELGKNVVTDVLRHNGFEVFDLGVDVSPERIADGVREVSPNILILSGTLKGSAEKMAESIAVLEKDGLRRSLRVIVGGAAATPQSAEEMGADAYSGDIKECLKACHAFMAMAAGEN